MVRHFLPKNAHVAFTKPTYPEPRDYYHTEPPEIMDEDFLFGGWQTVPSHYITMLKMDMDRFKGQKEPELVPKAPWPEGYAVEGDVIDKRDVFMQDARWPEPNEDGQILPTYFYPTASFPLPACG
jgi:hypothetical protein